MRGMSREETERMMMPKKMPKECMMGREVVRHSPARIGKKIEHLMDEGEPQKKAVAMALNMEREHRLTESGGYVPARKKRRK